MLEKLCGAAAKDGALDAKGSEGPGAGGALKPVAGPAPKSAAGPPVKGL